MASAVDVTVPAATSATTASVRSNFTTIKSEIEALQAAVSAQAATLAGLVIGSTVQGYDAGLASIAGLTTSSDTMIYTTSSDVYATASLTGFARTLLDDADATAARATLNLSTMATQNAGAVAITGGTIDGATVGASTPAAGTFTTSAATTQVVVGNASAVSLAGSSTHPIEVISTGSQNAAFAQFSANVIGPSLRFFKSRGTTIGSAGAVAAADQMLNVATYGSDGTSDIQATAIRWRVAGTVSVGNVPGSIDFQTRNLAGTLALRLTLDSEGNLVMGGTATAAADAVGALHLLNGTAPSAGVANGAVMYAGDVSSSSVMQIMNESGDIIVLDQQAALTAASGGSPNSGDATTDTIISNLVTRLGELETRLTTMGILAS